VLSSVSKITQTGVAKFWRFFWWDGVCHWQQTGFGGDPDHDVDPGIFKRIFTIVG